MESLVESVLEEPDFFKDFRSVDFLYLIGTLNLRALEFEELSEKARKDGYPGISFGYRCDAGILWKLSEKFSQKEKERDRSKDVKE